MSFLLLTVSLKRIILGDNVTKPMTNGRLVFRDRNNNRYDWEVEHDILIKDNAIKQEPEPPPNPDIPAEIPGVEEL